MKNSTLPEVPDDGPSDPGERRRQVAWMLVLCLIIIIAATAVIVNELIRQHSAN
jgi:hypothetical protein